MENKLRIREQMFETMAGKELFEFTCGELLGYGIHRAVFVYNPDPTCVIKYQYVPSFQNVREWDLWNDLEHNDEIRKWLAPCVRISENGIWLVQKRTKLVPKGYKMPERVPRFMTDIKQANFGIYKGRLVSHDYANHLCVNYAISKAMKKAEWF